MIGLKNTKVYTKDADVIRKYAELCGKEFCEQFTVSAVGVFNQADSVKIYDFAEDSIVDKASFDLVSPEHVKLMYTEKFEQIESPEEKEAFDSTKEIDFDHPVIKSNIGENESIGFRLKNGSGSPNGSEWKVGDRVTIKNPEGFGIWDEAEKYLGTNGTVMAVFTNTNGKKVATVSHDDSVCICWMLSMLEKPESPEQKTERERLEAAYDLYCSAIGESACMYQAFLVSPVLLGIWCKVVDKTGYRKEQ
ncbi:hypothetical protein Athena1_0031 [Vibrio phage Athena1]|nr:hypothetical protein Athena1_0031 [Vibrio phage Athena1]